FFKFYI
ncbi:hypothetical protein EC951288_1998B, partial [Escherichia coli 95.1288]